MILVLLLVIVIAFLIIYAMERKASPSFDPSLEKDGLMLMDHPSRDDILRKLPEGYEFLDYIYTIHGCTLSTFHRDVTSSQYIFKTKHPVYTFITYDYDGPALSVCPGSHQTAPFLMNRPVIINSNSVLFNCDVVHAGSLNLKKKPRRAIQYKIAQRYDLEKLKHLDGIDKVKKGDCDKRNNPVLDTLYRKLSLTFSYIINHHLTPYLQNRENNFLCKLLGEERCFYNK